jgi:hypothetical protein
MDAIMLRLIVSLVFLCFCAFAQAQSPTESIANIKQRLQASTEKPLDSLQVISGKSLSYQTAQPALHNLKLPSGELLSAELRRQHADINGVTTLTANTPQGKVRVNTRGNTSITTIRTDKHRWKVITIDGESLIYDDYELPARIPEDDAIPMGPHQKTLSVAAPEPAKNNTDGPQKTFDAVVLYTQATIDYYEGEDLALARIADIVDTTNEIYVDSNVPLIMNLHKTFLVNYDPENEKNTIEALLEMNPDSPHFGAAYAYAQEAGIDYLITMRPFVDGDGFCGLALAGGQNNQPYDPDVVMVSHTTITCGDFTNAHELGHNMGLAHSKKQGEEGYVFPYARGYGKQHDFVTVMAYVPSFGEQGNYPEKLYKFSSPDLDCNGSPCGIDHTQADGADAARALATRTDKITEIRDLVQLDETFVSVNSPYARIGFNSEKPQCTGVCSRDYPKSTAVTITAEAIAGYEFIEWSDHCETRSGNQCQLTTSALHGPTPKLEEIYVEGVSPETALNLGNIEIDFIDNEPLWRIDEQTKQVGDYSLRSPYLEENAWPSIAMKVAGRGELSFWLKTSFGKDNNLKVRFGDTVIEVNGKTEWTQYHFTANPDYNAMTQLIIELARDNSAPSGDHRFWVDGVTFTPDPDARQPISVQASGAGVIEVQTEPFPRTCQNTCDMYPEPVNGKHKIVAVPDDGEQFIGWGGDCRGTDPQCVVNADSYRRIFAYFSDANQPLTPADIAEILDTEKLHLYPSKYSAEWQIHEDASQGNSSLAGKDSERESGSSYYALKTELIGAGTFSFDYKISDPIVADDNEWFEVSAGSSSGSLNDTNGQWQTYTADFGEGARSVNWDVQLNRQQRENRRTIAIDNVQWTGDAGPSYQAQLDVSGANGAIRMSNNDYCRNQCTSYLGGYSNGDKVTFYAEPDPYVEFVRWKGACAAQGRECELIVGDIENAQITAVFQNVTYRVTAEAGEGGQVSPAKQYVVAGLTGEIMVTPLVGHKITDTRGCNGALSGNIYTTDAVFANCGINAEFEKLKYQVTFDLGEYAQRTGGGELQQVVKWGNSAVLPEFNVTDGWHFAGWSQPVSPIVSDSNIKAIYQKVAGAVRVELSVSDNASLSVEPLQYIQKGSSLTLAVSPEPGYRVRKQVAGSCPAGEWTDNRYRIASITEDCSARFSVTPVLKSSSLLLILSTEGQEATPP